ncbi:solute carrier family 17 member 9-like [Hydractinia symbiolongicarpus]|uniref:solute carrier family 17 member 9-like n=1 Tax=Hydractinia symbiolongicarpus TaxID=13093 RepID=UPI00254C25C9|nr:solute carrier family 17 member 9-like [Hydractinia symbiolongicarpus]
MDEETEDDDFEFVPLTEIYHEKDTSKLIRNIKERDTNENPQHWSRKGRIKWTFTLFFGCFLAYSSRTTMSICAVQIGKDLGWDKRLSGIVLSSFFFGYILTQVLGGVLADHFGGERMLYISSGIWSVATFSVPFITRISWFPVTIGIMLAQVISGAAQGVHFPAIASLLSKSVAIENRNTVFSFAASGTAVGMIFSGLAGSVLLGFSGWRSVFFLTGGLSISWALLVGILISRENVYKEREIASFDKRESVPWGKFLCSKPFWALMICATCESLVFTNLLSWLPTYFHDEFPESKGWLFNVCPWIASFVLQNVCGMLSDRMVVGGVSRTKVRKIFVSMALISTTVLCLILNQVTSFSLALLLMTSIIGLLGCNSSGIGMNPQDLAPKHAGSLFGIMNTLGAISGMAGVYLTGHILHTTKQWSSVFHMTSAVSLIGAVSFLLCGTGRQIG